jgi:hypothetical protein
MSAIFPAVGRIFPAVGRLRFGDDPEPSFAEYHAEHSLTFARFGLALALMLYALFGVLDLYVAPGVAKWIWIIRYAIFCPVALIALGLTFTRHFSRIMQPALAAVAAVAGLGVVANDRHRPPVRGLSLLRGPAAGRPVGVHSGAAVLLLRHDGVPGHHGRLRGGRGVAEAHAAEILVNNNFPTMLISVHQWPPPPVAGAKTIRVTAGEWCRTAATIFTTGRERP